MAESKIEKQDILEKTLWMVKFRYLVIGIALVLGISGGLFARAFYSVIAGIIIALIVLFYNNLGRLYIKKNEPFLNYAQLVNITFGLFVLDILSITMLIHFTGGILSPFVLLYLYIIIAMSIAAPDRPIYAWANALLIILFYNGLLWSEYFGLLKPIIIVNQGLGVYGDQALFILYFFIVPVSILVIAFLATNLAKRFERMKTELFKHIYELEVIRKGLEGSLEKRKLAGEAVKSQARTAVAMSQIVLAGNRAEDLKTLLDGVLTTILDLLCFDGGGIYLVDEGKKTARVVFAKGLPKDFIENVEEVNITEAPYDQVFIKGQPIITENYDQLDPERSRKWGFMSLASIPIFLKDRIIGAINIASKKRFSFSDDEKNILAYVGREVGPYIQRMRVENDLKEKIKELEDLKRRSKE